ncbi:MAG: glutamine amidotransferase [Planctomycetota bacterium]|nr:glutamine amidotransferase [Planctomycetota bacterium]
MRCHHAIRFVSTVFALLVAGMFLLASARPASAADAAPAAPGAAAAAAISPVAGAKVTKLVEAETAVASGGKVYRDPRASAGRAAVFLLNNGKGNFLSYKGTLEPGDYVLTAWMEAQPVALVHGLTATITVGNAQCDVKQINFDAAPGYQPFWVRFTHPGGPVAVAVSVDVRVGFDGMRKDNTEEEQAEKKKEVVVDDSNLLNKKATKTNPDDLDLEEDPPISKLTHLDPRLVCDKLEFTLLRAAPSTVVLVEADKVHYFPEETANIVAHLDGGPAGGTYKFVADDITETDQKKRVFTQDVTLAAKQKLDVTFGYPLKGLPEFGHEIRCALLAGDKEAHANSEFFGMGENVYRMGITGSDGYSHDRSHVTVEGARAAMVHNKKLYANYFEVFAWGPCDYSNLNPTTEHFFSGQTQYHGTISGFKTIIAEAHKYGVKAITYGKSSGASIAGLDTFQRHPELFGYNQFGTANEQYNTYLLERMFTNDYRFPDVPEFRGWQHWMSIWTVDSTMPERFAKVCDFGADQLIQSAKTFGWDGVRWDGHFPNGMERTKKRLNDALPRYVHGYNIAFANPGSKMFMPPDMKDFHECAKGHGLMMDESVREWSMTAYNPGIIRPFYDALGREADYIKRIGGLPLYITFDMGTQQDVTFNVLCGLAAGQRYTYMTTPGDFGYGPLTRFLTRYAAFVWDDTACIADADKVVSVAVGKGPKDLLPWWNHTTWLRKLPDGRQQLLVNLVNPPGYPAFYNRVQTPPTTLGDVSVSVPTPAGAKLTRVMHISPDLVEGLVDLPVKAEGAAASVVLPRLRNWSIVAFEYAPASGELAYPAFKLTTPVEDAKAVFDKAEGDKIANEQKEKAAAAGIAPTKTEAPAAPYYQDFAKTYNADKDVAAKLPKPTNGGPIRNGVLDVLHVKGVWSWLNPYESAIGIAGGGNYDSTWVVFQGWRNNSDGAMDSFPESMDALMKYDVIVVDDMHAGALGPRRRSMIAEYVRSGGGLVVMGGYYNLSLGMDCNTALAEILPIDIVKYENIVRDDKGLPLKPAKPDFAAKADWSKAPLVFCLDASPVKPGAEVLATAGDKPVVVAQSVGKGRVVVVLANCIGNYADGALPYWLWPDYPRLLAACVQNVAGDFKAVVKPVVAKRELDAKEVNPDNLMIEASLLASAEFTKRLKSAVKNIVDPTSAKTVMETALDNVDKIDDQELLAAVADAAGEYLDASFAPIAKKLLASQHAPLRKAGYQVLGLAGDKQFHKQIEVGLESEQETANIRAALIALGQLRDSGSIICVRKYLEKGTEKLLALGVLKRLGDPEAVALGVPQFAFGLHYAVAMRCNYWGQYETLYGGTSFKLTVAARRKANFEMGKIIEKLKAAEFDTRYYVAGLDPLSDAELTAVTDYLRAAENPAAAPLAFTLTGRLPDDRASAFRKQLADAKLPDLRALATK